MKWSEIKKWAKTKGYNVSRDKANNSDKNTYDYTWTRNEKTGAATSVLELATNIYNDITDNKHLAYQSQYKKEYEWFKNYQ